MPEGPTAPVREAYKTRCAVNDLLGLSTAVGLLIHGIEGRLRQEQLDAALSDDQEERLRDLFLRLRQAAEEIADFAREVAEQAR
jgi:hypothetical protein